MARFRPSRTKILVTIFISCSVLTLIGLWSMGTGKAEQKHTLIEHVEYYTNDKQETVQMSVFFKQGSHPDTSYLSHSELNINQNLATRIEVVHHDNTNSPTCSGKYVMIILSLSSDTAQTIEEVNSRINIVNATLNTMDDSHQLQTYSAVQREYHSLSSLSAAEQNAGIIQLESNSQSETFSQVLSFVQHNCAKMEYLIFSRDSTLVNTSRLTNLLETRGTM